MHSSACLRERYINYKKCCFNFFIIIFLRTLPLSRSYLAPAPLTSGAEGACANLGLFCIPIVFAIYIFSK